MTRSLLRVKHRALFIARDIGCVAEEHQHRVAFTLSVVHDETLGPRFRAARKSIGLTQEALAHAMKDHGGPNHRAVQLLETGKTKDPGAATIYAWARVTGVSADWLLGLTTDGGPETSEQTAAANIRREAVRVLTESRQKAHSSKGDITRKGIRP